MLSAIPVIGWFLHILVAASMAVPFWFFWTIWGIGGKFFYFLPPVYHNISFFNCVALFVCVSIVKNILLPSMNVNAEAKGKD